MLIECYILLLSITSSPSRKEAMNAGYMLDDYVFKEKNDVGLFTVYEIETVMQFKRNGYSITTEAFIQRGQNNGFIWQHVYIRATRMYIQLA